MGEGVNGRLKHRHMPTARIPGRIAEAVFLVAAVDIFPEAAGNAPHTGKLCFPRIILSHKHTALSDPSHPGGLPPPALPDRLIDGSLIHPFLIY